MLIHWYRVSNWLWRHGVPVLPKLMWKLQYQTVWWLAFLQESSEGIFRMPTLRK